MPRVLQVVPYLDARGGGPAVVVQRLVEHAGAHGWEAHVVSTPALSADDGLSLRRSAEGRYDLTLLSSQLAAFGSRGRTIVPEAVAKADIVHLHTMWSPLNLAVARVCRAVGKPYVLTPHGMLDPWSLSQKAFKKRLYLAAVERALIRHAASVVFTAEEEHRLAEGSIGPIARSAVIPLGADCPPENLAALAARFRARHPAIGGRPMILFLGRLHPKKRPEVLIEAMPAILARVPEAVLVLGGAGEPNFEGRLRARAKAAGLGDRVQFVGHLQDAEKWAALGAADLFVLPSLQENFGLAVAEALHAGTPVLITRRINIWREIVRAEAGVALCDDWKLNDLVARAAGLLIDETRRAHLAESASCLAAGVYSWPVYARMTCQHYECIIEMPYSKTQIMSSCAGENPWGAANC